MVPLGWKRPAPSRAHRASSAASARSPLDLFARTAISTRRRLAWSGAFSRPPTLTFHGIGSYEPTAALRREESSARSCLKRVYRCTVIASTCAKRGCHRTCSAVLVCAGAAGLKVQEVHGGGRRQPGDTLEYQYE